MVLKDKKTKITFHSGILTIGGTVIEVAYEDAHIFFDFGTEFNPSLQLEDEKLDTLIEHRLSPIVENVYDPQLSADSRLFSDNKFKETAVFLSHCHLDHSRMINYLDPAIPLYTMKETKVLLDSLNAQDDFLLPSEFVEGTTREMIGLAPLEEVHVGKITVQVWRVDHDAYGACAMLITTPDYRIAYTGDLRLHGFDAEDTLAFCEAAKGVDMLLIEGVTVSFDDEEEVIEVEDEATDVKEIFERMTSEPELVARFCEIVRENPDKQLTFNGYIANVKRLAEIVRQSPRPVVLEDTTAYVLKETLGLETYYYQKENHQLGLDSSLEIDYRVLTEEPTKYVWQITGDYEDLQSGGIYIHSNAAPLGPFDPAYEPFVKSFAERGITFISLQCSGHAFPEDLAKVISLIQPKLLVPIHSLKPERLENPYGERYLPTRGDVL